MEKKYYFRGLGLGIIVTAVIMGIALSGGTKRGMTDSEVIARAKELGMTENTRLLQPAETDESKEGTEPTAEKEAVTEPVKKDVSVAQPKEEATSQTEGEELPDTDGKEPSDNEESGQQNEPDDQSAAAQDAKPAANTNEMTKQDEDTGQKAPAAEAEESSPQTTAAASITIVSGDGSYTVAKKLEQAGVVSSASLYDDFLCRNGYDKRIRTGTFQIPAGASDEEIAKIVSNQQ